MKRDRNEIGGTRRMLLDIRSSMSYLFGLALAVVVFSKPATAEPTTTDKPSLDEQLLNDLDNELLEGLDDLPQPKKSKQSTEPEGAPKEAAGEDLGKPSEDDPLARVAHQMRQAERLIPAPEETPKTTKTQRQI